MRSCGRLSLSCTVYKHGSNKFYRVQWINIFNSFDWVEKCKGWHLQCCVDFNNTDDSGWSALSLVAEDLSVVEGEKLIVWQGWMHCKIFKGHEHDKIIHLPPGKGYSTTAIDPWVGNLIWKWSKMTNSPGYAWPPYHEAKHWLVH